MPKRKNSHLFWILYCIISRQDVAFSSLGVRGARIKFLFSYYILVCFESFILFRYALMIFPMIILQWAYNIGSPDVLCLSHV